MLKSRDDADKVSLLQVLEVGEAELVGVMGEVDCVDVPSDLFPVRQVVIVAVAGILCGKPPTGTLRMKGMKPLEQRRLGREKVNDEERVNAEEGVGSSIPCP